MSDGPDYKTRDPLGWCGDPSRGAALGRGTLDDPGAETFARPLALRHVPLSGDYDRNGTYWGSGEPLYWCASQDGTIDRMLRARNRDDAKRKVLAWYPAARFYR